MKIGMLGYWDQWGERHAVSVLQLDECRVVQKKTEETDGYNAVQLGVCEVHYRELFVVVLKHTCAS